MKEKKALVTGVTGQDGSYLAELLLSKDYQVHAMVRRSSDANYSRIRHILDNPMFHLHNGDLSDQTSIHNILKRVEPDEVYNLAAQSHVRISFDIPEYTTDVTGMGVVRMIESVKGLGLKTKIYQASSSEMFGSCPPKQSESSRFAPRSPYACAKMYAYWMIHNYREGYGQFASNGILFNHESPRRGEQFVTRKITQGAARIKAKKQEKLHLGNLSARRDWGFAPEYVNAMWMILQLPKADDFVIGTGEAHTVQEFLELAFDYADVDLDKHVVIDKSLYRPTEVDELVADTGKAKKLLDWEARIKFKDLIKVMVDADLREQGLEPIGEGDDIIRKAFPNMWWSAD